MCGGDPVHRATGVPGGVGRSTNRAERRPPSTRSVSESSGVRSRATVEHDPALAADVDAGRRTVR